MLGTSGTILPNVFASLRAQGETSQQAQTLTDAYRPTREMRNRGSVSQPRSHHDLVAMQQRDGVQ